jgi:hypothetical protein
VTWYQEALPKRVNEVLKDAAALTKEAKVSLTEFGV